MTTETKTNQNTFKVGDGVSWSQGSDSAAGTVTKVTPKAVWVVEDAATLINKPGSGEADAVGVYPGGFVAHFFGAQRYEYTPGTGAAKAFTLRKTGRYKEAGTSITGSMCSWGNLRQGRNKHRDYNF